MLAFESRPIGVGLGEDAGVVLGEERPAFFAEDE